MEMSSCSSSNLVCRSPEHLPTELWRQHLWPLLQNEDRAAFGATCKAARALVEQLVTSLHLTRACATSSCCRRRCSLHVAFAAVFARRLPSLHTILLDSGTCPLALLLDGPLTNGPPLPSVRALELASMHPDSDHALGGASLTRLLRVLPALRSVKISLEHLPSDLGEHLARCCPQLEELGLSSSSVPELPAAGEPGDPSYYPRDGALPALMSILQSLPFITNLQRLAFSQEEGLATESAVAGCLAAAAGVSSLRSLEWAAPWAWDALAPLLSLAHLSSLQLCQYPCPAPVPSAEYLRSTLGAMGSLVELRMPKVDLDARLWVEVLARLPSLQRLCMARCQQADGGFVGLALPPLLHLTELVLAAPGMAPGEALAAVTALPCLQRLACQICVQRHDEAEFAERWALLVALDRELLRLPARCVDAVLDLWVIAPQPLPVNVLLPAPAAAAAPPQAPYRFERLGRGKLFVGPTTAAILADVRSAAGLEELLGSCFPLTASVTLFYCTLGRLPAAARGPLLKWLGCLLPTRAARRRRGGAGAAGAHGEEEESEEEGQGWGPRSWAHALVQPARRDVTFIACSGLSVRGVQQLAVRLSGVLPAGREAELELVSCDAMGGVAARHLRRLAAERPGVKVTVNGR